MQKNLVERNECISSNYVDHSNLKENQAYGEGTKSQQHHIWTTWTFEVCVVHGWNGLWVNWQHITSQKFFDGVENCWSCNEKHENKELDRPLVENTPLEFSTVETKKKQNENSDLEKNQDSNFARCNVFKNLVIIYEKFNTYTKIDQWHFLTKCDFSNCAFFWRKQIDVSNIEQRCEKNEEENKT